MRQIEQEFHKEPGTTKVSRLADALSKAISRGKYPEGSMLPSVNQLSRQFGVSRDTVFKAYQLLKKRGIIRSTRAKAYYVARAMNTVLLLLDVYSPFKEALYNSFVNNLSGNFKVDLVFHFYNEHLFETVINDSLGRYTWYVVMNYSNEALHPSLSQLDPSKVLLLDLGDFDKGNYSYVCQDFGKSVYTCLAANLEAIKKYREFVLCLPEESHHPEILVRYFRKFARDNHIPSRLIREISGQDIRKGRVYLVIRQQDLVQVVNHCRQQNWKMGSELGLIAYNDIPVYGIIGNGITSLSTDFSRMGELAAKSIASNQKVNELIPARMILRASL